MNRTRYSVAKSGPCPNKMGPRSLIVTTAIILSVLMGCQRAPEELADKSNLIIGTVRDAVTKAPITGAQIIAVSPDIDMRYADCRTNGHRLEATTDANGRYQIIVPSSLLTATWSMRAAHLGHNTSCGALMTGGDVVEVIPGHEGRQYDFGLAPGLAVCGQVVDEAGSPIAGVDITALDRETKRDAYGYIAVTKTSADGRFVIYDYPQQSHPDSAGEIEFTHPLFCRAMIPDIYQTEPRNRVALKVVLRTGRSISGLVTDEAGTSVPDAIIEAETDNHHDRKSLRSGVDGRFRLVGLPSAPIHLYIRANGYDLQFLEDRNLTHGGIVDAIFTLSKAAPPSGPAHVALGMTMLDATQELLRRYHWDHSHGVIITAAAPVASTLGIGHMEEGDLIWGAGEKYNIKSVAEFVDEVLAPQHRNQDGSVSCRVVYAYRRIAGSGSNTQYLALSPAQVAELELLQQKLNEWECILAVQDDDATAKQMVRLFTDKNLIHEDSGGHGMVNFRARIGTLDSIRLELLNYALTHKVTCYISISNSDSLLKVHDGKCEIFPLQNVTPDTDTTSRMSDWTPWWAPAQNQSLFYAPGK